MQSTFASLELFNETSGFKTSAFSAVFLRDVGKNTHQ